MQGLGRGGEREMRTEKRLRGIFRLVWGNIK
jgi:hypothetical protein